MRRQMLQKLSNDLAPFCSAGNLTFMRDIMPLFRPTSQPVKSLLGWDNNFKCQIPSWFMANLQTRQSSAFSYINMMWGLGLNHIGIYYYHNFIKTSLFSPIASEQVKFTWENLANKVKIYTKKSWHSLLHQPTCPVSGRMGQSFHTPGLMMFMATHHLFPYLRMWVRTIFGSDVIMIALLIRLAYLLIIG